MAVFGGGGGGGSQDLNDVCLIDPNSTTKIVSAAGGTRALIDGTNGSYGFLQLGRGTNQIEIRSTGITAARVQTCDDMNGTIPVKITARFTTPMVVTSVYSVPHGLGFIPSFAAVQAVNAVTGVALAPGYSLSFDATNIDIKLATATAAAGTFSVWWMAYK